MITARDRTYSEPLLLQPCVSVGNVAQLAVDLLINTLSLSRAGHLHHPSILPLAGSGAYSHTPHSLHTAAEGGDWCVDTAFMFSDCGGYARYMHVIWVMCLFLT